MLLHISSKSDYDDFLHDEKNGLSFSDRKRLIQNQRFRSALWRFCHLDPSLISDVFLSLYSQVGGRPAFNPAILLRSYLFMQRLGFSSVDNWIAEARSDACIQYIIGSWNIPAVATHYDFINRIMQVDPHLDELYPSGKNSTETKKLLRKLKLKKNEKWENYDEGATRDLKDRYWDDASCDLNRSAFVVEQIFHRLVVIPSSDIGLIDSNNLVLSGDGSALHIHSSPFSHKVKDADTNDLTHRYTAPDADIGWDSDLGVAYFGYTLYNISHHNALLGIDLPVFFTLRTASQHDALITISAPISFSTSIRSFILNSCISILPVTLTISTNTCAIRITHL